MYGDTEQANNQLAKVLDEVREATSAANMPWLKRSDAGMVALAHHYASQIDAAIAMGMAEHTAKVIGWMGPHLQNCLRALGGAPIERLALTTQGKESAGGGKKLGRLRAIPRPD